ncbi:MAG: ferritin family protein [Desulfobacterales bacterium]
MFSVNEILDLAIQIEKNGESVYRRAMEEINESELTTLLEWMADEEIKHADWFASLKDTIESTGVNLFVEEMSRELFNDLLGEKSFSHKDVDFSKLKSTNELISVFIEFEKDTVIFYEVLVPFIEDAGTLETLDRIISEENNHIRRLQEFLQSEGERTSERLILNPFH